MPIPKTSRWLDLIAFLLAHRFPVTREQIYESVSGYKDDWERADDEKARESLRRKFERDERRERNRRKRMGLALKSSKRHTAKGVHIGSTYYKGR